MMRILRSQNSVDLSSPPPGNAEDDGGRLLSSSPDKRLRWRSPASLFDDRRRFGSPGDGCDCSTAEAMARADLLGSWTRNVPDVPVSLGFTWSLLYRRAGHEKLQRKLGIFRTTEADLENFENKPLFQHFAKAIATRFCIFTLLARFVCKQTKCNSF